MLSSLEKIREAGNPRTEFTTLNRQLTRRCEKRRRMPSRGTVQMLRLG